MNGLAMGRVEMFPGCTKETKAQEQTGPSLGHFGNQEGGGSQLLDRCPLELGEVVPTLMSREPGHWKGDEDHGVGSC